MEKEGRLMRLRDDGVIAMSPDDLAYWLSELGEYSTSIPTGVRIGKRWLRNKSHGTGCAHELKQWELCEYVILKTTPPGHVSIKRTPVYVEYVEDGVRRLRDAPD